MLLSHPKVFQEVDNESRDGGTPRLLRGPLAGPRARDASGCARPGLLDRRSDLYLLFLAGSPALDLVVANGFDALTMPPAPDWEATDGVLGPVWRWYRDYGRYLRVARRFLEGETDWDYYRFLLSDSELASAREAIRHRIPTALILDATRPNFARDP